MADSIYRMVLGLVFWRGANTLHGEDGVLRAAVAFFANTHLLAPQIAVDGVALGHFVVAIALRKAHAPAVAELADEVRHLPLDFGGRALGRVVEKNLVLDLQPAEVMVEDIQFLINGHG